MRVAVITFFQSQDNYGQLLQCFALQKILIKMGHSPFLIRYGFHQKYFRWFKKRNLLTQKGRKDVLLKITELVSTVKDPYDRGFDSFRKKHLSFSFRSYNTLAELKRNPPKADCYITGSDQVWAQLLSNPNNRSFYLDFGSNSVKRIAYAPSFAMEEYPLELRGILSDQLKRFDAISVRELSGVRICNSLGFDAKLSLDPTLLLTAPIYERILVKPTTLHYCFIYHVNVSSKDELFWNLFESFNRASDYKSIAAYANPIPGQNMEFLNGAEYVYPTIGEWLGYIYQSEYVLTSSYHGVVFSILFHRPFIVCLRKESMFAGNDRVMTLLKKLHLENRVANTTTSIIDLVNSPIDWESVEYYLQQTRVGSLSFLKSNLSK